MKLTLQISQSNLEIQHGHLWRGVTEQFHDGNKLYAGTKHLAGIGVAKLVRNDAFGDACLGTHRMQVSAEGADQGIPGAGAGQQTAIAGQWIERTEETETLDQFTHERVYRDHPFGLQLAERYMDRPLLGAGGVEAIEGKVGRFADAHAGVAKQKQDVGAEIVAAQQFLLEELGTRDPTCPIPGCHEGTEKEAKYGTRDGVGLKTVRFGARSGPARVTPELRTPLSDPRGGVSSQR
jgi:hypothetical protein